jgi:DNA polymerase-3 subunit gamma/tau
MENFIVSARKYRPVTFETVVGQRSITTTLKNAIKNNHLAHAYLFCGPRGVGKTTCARIFAKTINCFNITKDNEACDECESCKSFNENRSYSIHELDAASNNSVEDIRTLIEQVRIPPQIGKHSVYIIDEVHMLSSQAFNAFLKTLEEPPSHAIFVLATTERHKILPTILSRCQIFDFNRIKVEDTVEHLAFVAKSEGIEAEHDALNIIAQKADGAMRDALSFFDQIVSFSGSKMTYEDAIENLNVLDYDYFFRLTETFLENNISTALLTFNEILNKGFDGHHFITGLSEHFRNLLVCKDEITVDLLETGAMIKEKYKTQARKCDVFFLLNALNISNQTDLSYRESSNKRLQVELALLKLCNITQNITNSSVSKTNTENIGTKTEKPKEESKQISEKQDSVKLKTQSLKSVLNAENEKKSEISAVVKEPETQIIPQKGTLNPESVKKAWTDFAELLKDKPRLYNVLKSQMPTVTGNTVHFSCGNSLLKDALDKIKLKIIEFISKELSVSRIELSIDVVEENGEAKLYTNSDKYDYLSKKNENLNTLKNEFGLEFK